MTMNERDLTRMFRRTVRTWWPGCVFPEPRILIHTYRARTRRDGDYHHGTNTIRISDRVSDGRTIGRILRHEAIHWYLSHLHGRGIGHTREFWEWSKKLRCGDGEYRRRLSRRTKTFRCPSCDGRIRKTWSAASSCVWHEQCDCGQVLVMTSRPSVQKLEV